MTILSSPVKKHPGTVTLKLLTLPLFTKWYEAITTEAGNKDKVSRYLKYIPAICECVEKWSLDGFPEVITADTFPMDHAKSRLEVISWLFEEIQARFLGDGEDNPNG